MKKLFVFFLTLAMLFSITACNKGKDITDTPSINVTTTPTEKPVITDTTTSSENPIVTVIPKVTEAPVKFPVYDTETAVIPVDISVEQVGGYDYNEEYLRYYNDSEVAWVTVEVPYLSEIQRDSYSNAARAIDSVRETLLALARADLDSCYECAVNDLQKGSEYTGGYYSKYNLKVNRADSSVISFLIGNVSWFGDSYPEYCFMSVNIDTATGETIELSEVLTAECFADNSQRLAQTVKEELLLNGGIDESSLDFAHLTEYLSEEPLTWTMDYQGITLIIKTGDIVPNATGHNTIDLSFESFPSIFSGSYANTPENYMVGAYGQTLTYDIDGDGKYDFLTVSKRPYEDNEFLSETTVITIWDGATDSSELFEFDCSCIIDNNIENIFLLHMDNCANFLCETILTENDMRDLSIYRFTKEGIEKVREIELSYIDDVVEGLDYYSYTICNPLNFRMITRHDFFGTTFEYADYSFTADGEVEKLDEYYYFTGNFTVTTLKDMEFKAVDLYTGVVSTNETLPANTELALFRADGEGAVDFLLGNKVYRIQLDKTTYDDIDYVFFGYINGISIDEFFEGISYAG